MYVVKMCFIFCGFTLDWTCSKDTLCFVSVEVLVLNCPVGKCKSLSTFLLLQHDKWLFFQTLDFLLVSLTYFSDCLISSPSCVNLTHSCRNVYWNALIWLAEKYYMRWLPTHRIVLWVFWATKPRIDAVVKIAMVWLYRVMFSHIEKQFVFMVGLWSRHALFGKCCEIASVMIHAI